MEEKAATEASGHPRRFPGRWLASGRSRSQCFTMFFEGWGAGGGFDQGADPELDNVLRKLKFGDSWKCCVSSCNRILP